MACTTVLVGKKASYDGSTLIARTEDSGAGAFMPKKFVVVQPHEQVRKYKSVISKVEIDLPDNPMRYTAMPNALKHEGLWACCGVNEKNVAMSATETITSNERVLGADPLVTYIPAQGEENTDSYIPEQFGGIGEEDMVTLVLPYINSAKEGVVRLGSILEQYGTYEMNGIAFQDENDIWWLETIGGHHWMARRVPDECYAVIPNQLGIDNFDFSDAFGAQKDYMCSSDLKEFIADNHLDVSLDGSCNPRYIFGSNSDFDHAYNTPRAWVIQRYFNKESNFWDGIDADYRPDSDDLPWCRVPERKITIAEMKYVLSNHYQGTPLDPYGKYGDLSMKGAARPIGINRNNVLGLIQIRPYMPEAIKAIEWIAFGSDVFNAIVPFYVNINKTPTYLNNTSSKVTTENFYWVNRIIGALSDAQFSECKAHIEWYQLAMQSKGNGFLKKYDAKFINKDLSKEEISRICEEANDEIAASLRDYTDILLDKVLFSVSCKMKNSYGRSDA